MAPIPAAPQTIGDEGDQLVGKGDRTLKVGPIEVAVYRVALYVDTRAAREALGSFVGRSYDDIAKDEEFYRRFVEGRFRKTLRLAFMRRIPKAKLEAAFHGALTLRAGLNCASEIEQLTSTFADATDEDVVTLRLDGDGERVEMDATWREPPSLTIHSPGLWLAVQQIYFDERTEYPTVKTGLVRHLPDLVLADSLPSAVDDSPGSSAAHAESASHRSWREFAGRSTGKDGYKVGDLTRGAIAKMRGSRAGHSGDAAVEVAAKKGDGEVLYLQEIAQLRSELKRQEAASIEAASRQASAAWQSGSLFGACIAVLVMLIVNGLAPQDRERPIGLALLVVLLGCALLNSRQQAAATPSG